MFRDLPEFLRAGDLLVLNDSRVLPARLFGVRAGRETQAGSPQPSGVVEVLLAEEVGSREQGTGNREQGTGNREQGTEDTGNRGQGTGNGEQAAGLVWRALVRPAKKVRVGETLEFWESDLRGPGLKPVPIEPDYRGLKPAATPVLRAEVVEAGEFGERTLRFAAVEDFHGVVERIGHMPLPPYIRRKQAREADSEEDRERYQTVYARALGSAAAPTAGLHFTPEVLAALRARGVEIAYVTLHVGLGTFQPVRVDRVEEIRLHAERYTLPAATADALNRAMAEGRRVVAVGTTTTRALEHMAARAVAGAQEGSPQGLKPDGEGSVDGTGEAVPLSETGPASGVWMRFEAHSGSTSIFIGPGYRFRVVGGLLTNFHLPESTLLMLVSAFAGDRGRETVLAAYTHAVRERYRFYSYGDCMLVV